MMNSDRDISTKKDLFTIFDLLSEQRMTSKIDEPIDLAAQGFQFKVNTPLSHSDFNKVIAEFVHHIYQKGLRVPRNLSEREALGEAVSFLRTYYRGVYTSGYDGALLDATSSDMDGLDVVLSRLAESIKETERTKYTEWVFVHNIEQLDWEKRYRLVSAYLKQYEDFLPPQLRHMDPARLVDYFQDLIVNHLSTDSQIKQVFGTDVSWSCPE